MNVQDTSDLLADGPGELLDRSLEDYATLLRQAGELLPEYLEAVDYAVRHTVLRLFIRSAEEEELEKAHDALRRLVPVTREAELASWLPRWRGFADLIESRLAVLANQDPTAVRSLAHSSAILALVGNEPGLKQSEIGKRLGLKPANLSRILNVLEAHELIERQSVGRERRVSLGRVGRPAADVIKGDVKPGREYLFVTEAVA
jgi:DNA-binding transcriptional ArsR family regulator